MAENGITGGNMVNEEVRISKHEIDVKKLKSETVPNPVVLGGIEEIGLKRISPVEIPKYLLMHPALPRGIEIKANRMIKLLDGDLTDNVRPNKSNNSKAKEAAEYCKRILYDSGGPLFVKQFAQGAYRFGTSFAMLQTNMDETEVLRFEYEHEIFFGPARYPDVLKGTGINWGNIPMIERPLYLKKLKINPKTKKIAKYTQMTKKASTGELIPYGEEIDESMVFQLAFDTIGDEPLGISLVQFLYLTIQYLISMERAGAQTMINFGFNKWVANTPFKDIIKMKAFSSTLANLQKDSVVVLPEGIDLKNIEPGTTEFDRIHPIYMRLIAIRLGIPYTILAQEGTTTNKSTIDSLKAEMYEDFRADELTIERAMNEAFFKACAIKWKDKSIKELMDIVPKFYFSDAPEDLDATVDRDLKFSLMIRNYSTAAKDWATASTDVSVIENLRTKINYLIMDSMEDDNQLLLSDLTKKGASNPVEVATDKKKDVTKE